MCGEGGGKCSAFIRGPHGGGGREVGGGISGSHGGGGGEEGGGGSLCGSHGGGGGEEGGGGGGVSEAGGGDQSVSSFPPLLSSYFLPYHPGSAIYNFRGLSLWHSYPLIARSALSGYECVVSGVVVKGVWRVEGGEEGPSYFLIIGHHFPTTLNLLFITVRVWVRGTVISNLPSQVLVVVGVGLEAWGSDGSGGKW